jgi:hypothetical protein
LKDKGPFFTLAEEVSIGSWLMRSAKDGHLIAGPNNLVSPTPCMLQHGPGPDKGTILFGYGVPQPLLDRRLKPLTITTSQHDGPPRGRSILSTHKTPPGDVILLIAPTPSKMATHAMPWKDESVWLSAGPINHPLKGPARKKFVYEYGLFHANPIRKKHHAKSPRLLK